MGNCCTVSRERIKVKNTTVTGHGGDVVVPLNGKVWVCIAAFDYKGYGCEKHKIPPLSSCLDGWRFAKLSRDSGADVREFYDRRDMHSSGFPSKSRIIEEWRRIGGIMGPNDVFVFFYAGHGSLQDKEAKGRTGEADDEDGDVRDQALCFVEPDGSPNFWRDDDIAHSVYKDFHPDAHLLFVTDCCHSGTVCDLSRKILVGRPIVHLAAVKDEQCAQDLGDGGAFTCSIVETLEHLVRHEDDGGEGERDFSVTHVFNTCHKRYSYRFKDQDFCFENTAHFDPDSFRWPVVPPKGWSMDLPPLDSGPRGACC